MILGRYRVLAELGRGGMGVIHLAQASGPGGFEKLVALKELRAEVANDDEHRRMFLEEARVGARLAHPNIVEVHDVGVHEGRFYMALEYLDGCSLGRAKKRLGDRLPLRLVVRVLSDVLGALHHAHARGVVHRDVSAENVFITFDGRVKLLDFGVAKARDRSHATREGVVKGSLQYMSPDHVAADPIDGRADVFAAGVLLREALSGERLWPDDLPDLAIVRRLIAKDLPPFPVRALATTSPVLRAICAKATRAERRDRFATALAMKEALDAWLAVEDPRGTITELATLLEEEIGRRAIELPSTELVTRASVAREASPRPRSRWARRIVIASTVIAAMLAAGVASLRSQEPHEPTATKREPRREAPVLVKLDTPPPRPLADQPTQPEVDRFDPGY